MPYITFKDKFKDEADYNEYLYELVDDHISTNCEEDSWEKSQDIDCWSTEELEAYAIREDLIEEK